MRKLLLGLIGLLFAVPAVAATLPAGYTELQYIESTGTQWIDTGINDVDKVETELNMGGVSSYKFAFGNYSGESSDVIRFILSGNSSNIYPITNINSKAGGGSNSLKEQIFSVDSYHTVIMEDLVTEIRTTVDDYSKTIEKVTGDANAVSIALFANAPNGTTYARVGFKYWRAYKNGVLVRNMIPAKNSSGVIGMYDTVNNEFYTNQGTGTFTAGPVVLNPCRNLFDYNARTDGVFLNSDGTLSSQSGDAVSDFIPVEPNTTYYLSATGSRRGKFFDSNKQPIDPSSFDFTTANAPTSFTTGSTTRYVRFGMSGTTYDRTHIQLELGSTATEYVPYCATNIKIATTAYNSARFSPVVTELNTTIATIRDVVTNTINQTKAIADLQATKQTRPDETCPAGKKCLLVEDNDGTPHWFEIVESAD